jgi:hypothetical protein
MSKSILYNWYYKEEILSIVFEQVDAYGNGSIMSKSLVQPYPDMM